MLFEQVKIHFSFYGKFLINVCTGDALTRLHQAQSAEEAKQSICFL